MQNFTIQDLLGSALAVVLFPIVLLIPGYLVGWVLNIFDFRNRRRVARYLIGLILSNAIIPIIAFLGIRYLPTGIVVTSLAVCGGLFFAFDLYPVLKHGASHIRLALLHTSKPERFALLLGGLWVVFSLLLLVDIQIGRKLYFATTSYDYTTRISIINAITRTGVPPINPGYFPGHSEKLTFLYYYWYIPESLVERISGGLVVSRQAMLAGEIWTGLCLMALIAIYLRLRNRSSNASSWYAPLIGLQLLCVSGVDVIPVLAIALGARRALGHMVFNGRIEGWNMPIMSWLNALTWVPNHVSAAVQCITAMLLILSVMERGHRERLFASIMAGVAFASSLGSSVWVTLVFAIAWSIWAVTLAVSRKSREVFLWMAFAGAIGVVLSIPFIRDLLSSGGSASTGPALPIAFYVRPFVLATLLLPERLWTIGNLLLLPVNYAMELGFFFMTGLIWLQFHKNRHDLSQPFIAAEGILLATTVLIVSFVYSNIITINDLGIRAWLPGQFVLLIWATDLIRLWLGNKPPWPQFIFASVGKVPGRVGRGIQVLLVLGLLTTGLEAFSTRMWPILVDWQVAGFPNDLSPDTNLGSRTYDARLAYDFVNQLTTPTVAQINPEISVDRPSGLYSTVQIAIADRTAYGVSSVDFEKMQKAVAPVFEKELSWPAIDSICTAYAINTMIVDDIDPIWRNLPLLEEQRKALFQNDHYAVFRCGDAKP